MGIRVKIGNIDIRNVGGINWAAYWAAHLFGQDDLALWIKSRSGNSLVDEYGNDATILTPVLDITNANYGQIDNAGLIMTTNSFAIEWYGKVTSAATCFLRQNGGYATAAPGYSVTPTNIQLSSEAKVIYNSDHNLVYADDAWHHIFIIVNRAGYLDAYKDGIRTLHIDISGDAAESLTNANTITSVFGIQAANIVGLFSYYRIYKFAGAVPADIATLLASNYTTKKVVTGLLSSLYCDFNLFSSYALIDTAGNGIKMYFGGTWPTTAYNINGSNYALDNGYELYQKSGSADIFVPLMRTGLPTTETFSVLYIPAGYVKVRNVVGDETGLNNFNCLIGFNEAGSANAVRNIFDRSNTTIYNATCRAASYYDVTSLATRSRFHISEIADPRIYRTYFNVGYKGKLYSRITTVLRDYPYDIISIGEIILYNTDNKGNNDWKIWAYCRSGVYALAPAPVYDGDNYVTQQAPYSVTKIPMVVFIDDDGSDHLYTLLYPIFQAKGENFSAAIVSDWINSDADNITTAQMLEMQAAGTEMCSHLKTHSHIVDLTDAQFLAECVESKAYLESLGAIIHNMVYPFYEYDANKRAGALTVYEACGGNATNTLPISLGDVGRISMQVPSLATLQGYVDTLKADNGNSLMMIVTHAFIFTGADFTKLGDLIDYIQSEGVAIVTFKQAIEKIKSYDPQSYKDI